MVSSAERECLSERQTVARDASQADQALRAHRFALRIAGMVHEVVEKAGAEPIRPEPSSSR
jgi:hypothetical protein